MTTYISIKNLSLHRAGWYLALGVLASVTIILAYVSWPFLNGGTTQPGASQLPIEVIVLGLSLPYGYWTWWANGRKMLQALES